MACFDSRILNAWVTDHIRPCGVPSLPSGVGCFIARSRHRPHKTLIPSQTTQDPDPVTDHTRPWSRHRPHKTLIPSQTTLDPVESPSTFRCGVFYSRSRHRPHKTLIPSQTTQDPVESPSTFRCGVFYSRSRHRPHKTLIPSQTTQDPVESPSTFRCGVFYSQIPSQTTQDPVESPSTFRCGVFYSRSRHRPHKTLWSPRLPSGVGCFIADPVTDHTRPCGVPVYLQVWGVL